MIQETKGFGNVLGQSKGHLGYTPAGLDPQS